MTKGNIWRLLWLLAIIITSVCQGDESRKDFTHVISWGPWKSKAPHDFLAEGSPQVYLDNKLLGPMPKAYAYLNSLDVGEQDQIKIQLPFRDSANAQDPPLYSGARFMLTWLKKGVHFHFIRGSKEYPAHVLTWTEFVDDKGVLKQDLNTAHLVLDGHDLGQIDEGFDKLNKMHWGKGILLQVYYPNEDERMLDLGRIEIVANELAHRYGFEEETITPVY